MNRKAFGLGAVLVFAAAATARAQTGTDLLQILPDDSGVVIIDVQKLRASELWASLKTQPKTKEVFDRMAAGLENAGIKLDDVTAVAVSFRDLSWSNFTIAVNSPLDPAALLARLQSDPTRKMKQEKYREVDIYTISFTVRSVTQERSLAFLDPRTVVVGSTQNVRAAVDVKAGEKRSIAQNSKLTALLAQTLPAVIRFAVVPQAGLTGALQSNTIPLPDFASVRQAFGTVEVTGGIQVNATLRNDTAEHAKVIADQLNGLLAMAKGFLGSSTDPRLAPIVEMLKTISITGSDVDVNLSLSLPKEFLAQVIR